MDTKLFKKQFEVDIMGKTWTIIETEFKRHNKKL